MDKKEQTPQEIIAKLAAMTPAEFNQFMHWHFHQLYKRPLPDDDTPATLTGDHRSGDN